MRPRHRFLTAPVLVAGIMAITAPVLAAGAPLRLGNLAIGAAGPGRLDIGLGAFNFYRRGPAPGNDVSPEGELEWRGGPRLFGLGPAGGVMVNGDGGTMAYAGVYTDFRDRRWSLTPELALGAYHRGAGKALGGIFEFRLAAELDYRLRGGDEIGLRFAHISNAGIHDRNPGEQEILATWAWPFF
jgi:hypothetical protein